MNCIFSHLVTIIFLIQARTYVSQESCVVRKTNSPGICQVLTDCNQVLEDIRKGERTYTLCTMTDSLPYVCCPTVEVRLPEEKPTIKKDLQGYLNARISEKKCHEYSQYVFQESNSISLMNSKNKEKRDMCGHKKIPLIAGGTEALPREFPHMALIGYDENGIKKYSCGGTLISERYVLTAGHCTTEKSKGLPKYIRLGELSISNTEEDDDPEDFTVSEVIRPPNYSRYSNDIALLKLDRDVILNPYKRPACLPNTSNITNQVIATGWGHTSWQGKESDSLLKVVIDIFNETVCSRIYSHLINIELRNGINGSTQFCAGSWTEKKDTCHGDSGGPVQIYSENEYCMYDVIGVTSFGVACGKKKNPGVYTRVFPHLDWIEGIVWKNND